MKKIKVKSLGRRWVLAKIIDLKSIMNEKFIYQESQ